MVARLYFPFSEVAAVSPAFDASWNITTGAVRRRLRPVPGSAGSTSSASGSETSASATNVLVDQFVSDSIPANVTITGNVTAAFLAQVNNLDADAFGRIVVRVVSSTGSVVRGTLFDGLSAAEINTTSTLAVSLITGAVTSVAALAGDRIVVERGFRFTNTVTASKIATAYRTDDSNILVVDNQAVSGADETTSASSYRPWVEFSQDNIWAPVNRRVGSAAAEVMIDGPHASSRIGAVASEVMFDPPRTNSRIGAVASEVMFDPPRPDTRIGAVALECLIPLDGQRIRTIHPVGNVDQEIYVKIPGIGWRAVQPKALHLYTS